MNYLLDTNVLLHYLRATPLKEIIDARYQPFALENEAIICVVSIGELLSLSLRNHWGEKKIQTLTHLLSLFVVADIHFDHLDGVFLKIEMIMPQ